VTHEVQPAEPDDCVHAGVRCAGWQNRVIVAFMDSNPYKPSAALKCLNSRSRLMTSFEIAAVVCGGLPLVYLVGLVLAAKVVRLDALSDLLVSILVVSSAATVFLWLVGGVYNLVGVMRGRHMSVVGTVLNTISLVIWTFSIAIKYL
jgi:hypothetical protein